MKKIVELHREIPFPVDRVFAAWTNPQTFAEWFHPDADVKLGRVEADTREGGHFLIEMIVGGNVLPHTGVYQKIVPGKALSFTWHSGMTGDIDTLVEVVFEASGSGTRMTLRHSGLEDAESREAHAEGWANIMAGLEPYLLTQGRK